MQARKKLYDVYGEKSFTERQRQNWFACFRSGDFDLRDAPRSGRPTEVDEHKIKAMIENNRRSTTREIAEKFNISHTRSVWKVSGQPLYLRAIVFERPLRSMNVNSKASRAYRLLADICRTYSSCVACLCLQSYF